MSEQAFIKDLVIELDDIDETDEQIWEWAVKNVFMKNAIPVTPWTKHTMTRDHEQNTVTISLNIPISKEGPLVQ